ncbi:MAG: response regulator [Acidobacteriota bacterium]|nr:response regulator [Acidobacteriota bacterium]
MKINNRLLIVDDDQNIHDDFNKILNPSRITDLDRELLEIEASLFENPDQRHKLAYKVEYSIDHAFQGGEALEMIESAQNEGRPYSLMFTDVRIPPGIDGITLVKKVRVLAPHMQVVIVTAFSDYTWEEITEIFGWTDQLLILRKPVDPITVKQVALMLTKKYSSETELRNHRDQLEGIVNKRTEKLMLANQRLSVEIADRQRAEKALQMAHAQLAATNQDLSFEIMQRRQTEEQMKVLLDDLGTANQELENFAYVVSHDLKAPLRAIHSITSWLSEDYIDQLGEEGGEYINDLLEQTRWMHNLIEGILQYSRLGRVKLEMEDLDTLTLTKRLVDMLAPPEGIAIEVSHTMPELVYDRTHLEQVFQNLVENAIKHMNNPKGTVTIACEDTENFWKFSVADTGVGIADKHHERIFKIFQTLKPRDGSDGSTGIGLSLVKKIVEHHGGTIWVESEPGKGSIFYFTIPKDLKLTSGAGGYTVLTIDDNRDFGDVTTAMLKRAGYKPLYAQRGSEALTMVRNHNLDIHLVLLDVNLPGERIFDLYEKLRYLDAKMRIVACTGDFMSEKVEKLREMGIDGVLAKPFNIEELNEVLQAGLVKN